MDKAKRGKKVKYHITYRVNGKQKQEFVGHSIEDAKNADAARKTQKRETICTKQPITRPSSASPQRRA